MEPEHPSLIEELRRRRVFRAVVGYGVVAFAVLQIIEPIMHGLHWPDEVLTWLVVALAVGFPVVVGLAWIFDVNAGRVERTGPAPGLRGARLVAILMGVAVLSASPGLVWFFVLRSSARAPKGDEALRVALDAVPPGSDIHALPSIAVLPLVNLSHDPDQEYFSDGVAEEILNALAQVEGLHVAGRTSSFSFKGKNEDLRSIGQKLGVGTVLEGSVRKQGDKVRITAQLINVADGFHLWSKNFDRDLKDVFAVQEEIGQAVVEGLKIKLLPGKPTTAPERRTTSIEAYELYLTGMKILSNSDQEQTLRAQKALARAVELDPGYGPAWSGLSLAASLLSDWAPDPAVQRALQQQALAAATRAIQVAPDLAESWTRRGLWHMEMAWDWRRADEDISHALALNPADVTSLDARARLFAVLGQVQGAIAAALRVTELDRLNYPAWIRLSFYYFGAGQLRDARAALEKARALAPREEEILEPILELDVFEGRAAQVASTLASLQELPPDTPEDTLLVARAHALHLLGSAKGSQAALDELIAKFGAVDAYQIAQIEASRGAQDRAFEWLERARQQHDGGLVGLLYNSCSLKCDPFLRSLHKDPRWAALLKAMNLPLD